MRVARLLRPLYHLLDRFAWSRLSLPAQRRSKAAVIEAARRWLPGRIPAFSVEALLTDSRQFDPQRRGLPQWAREDMADAARTVAPELNPNAFLARRPQWTSAPVHRVDAGKVYAELRRQLSDDIDTLFLVPWLTRGGADLGTLHYVRACVEAFGHKVAVIATEPQPSVWAKHLPQGVPFIEAGPLLSTLDTLRGEQVAVMARLLLQAKPKHIHVVNSRLGWQVIKRHAVALRRFTRLHASLFCDDQDEQGFLTGLAVDFLRDTAHKLDSVITDNRAAAMTWIHAHGIDPALIHVVHFPYDAPSEQIIPPRGNAPAAAERPRLLWAGRLVRQKRPDVLLGIAQRLPGVDFDVHGISGTEPASPLMTALRRQPNVHLHGPFASLAQIAGPQHAAFLYTTGWDGLPTVLLQACAVGLPVIAPDIGGISDLLAPQDLVHTDGDLVAAYVSRIEAILADPLLAQRQLARQSAALPEHDWAGFIQALGHTPYYTEPAATEA